MAGICCIADLPATGDRIGNMPESNMVLTKSLSASVALLVLLSAGLGGCLGVSDDMVVYRDLADIPERPDITAREVNDEAAKALAADRARAAQAIESLRSEPFTPPEPAPPRPDP
jgi:hypothetical protein